MPRASVYAFLYASSSRASPLSVIMTRRLPPVPLTGLLHRPLFESLRYRSRSVKMQTSPFGRETCSWRVTSVYHPSPHTPKSSVSFSMRHIGSISVSSLPQDALKGFVASAGTLFTCLKMCRLSLFLSSICSLILSCTSSASGSVFPFP